MFAAADGRPAGELIRTPLLGRLREWAQHVAAGRPETPRVVLLVGGPGNGKTEAVEDCIRELESSLAFDGQISGALGPQFNPVDGSTVPRSVRVDLTTLGVARALSLTLVQDASVGADDEHGPAESLIRDLETTLGADASAIYLACVNRGILDDALIAAHGTDSQARKLLSAIVGALAAQNGAPSCWPLHGFPDVAIWPMDVESLFLAESDGQASPAHQALSLATAAARWPALGTCAAGDRCPFCYSRSLLEREPYRSSLLRILRGYELATGKRWSFRDLLSLLSFLLAGSPGDGTSGSAAPCEMAAKLATEEGFGGAKGEGARLAAPFLLVAAQYQHALFGIWPSVGRGGLRKELREVGLDDNPTLRGLGIFLSGTKAVSVPRTLRTELSALCAALDPSCASPDLDIDVSGRTTLKLRDIDARFSHSVRDGLEMLRKYKCLSANETELLRRLADADDKLGEADARNKKPTTAAALQVLLRDFSCRLVRRSLGVRNAVVRDFQFVEGFAKLVGGDDQLAVDAAKRVEGLLNPTNRFTVILNNTFGEPPPPLDKRVVLETDKQRVRPAKSDTVGRPRADLRFLTVGAGTATQHIALTYELFRAVQEKQAGMLSASLPRPVVAAIDAARARLAGRIVRGRDALEGAEISIGTRSERILVDEDRFIVRAEAEQ